MLITDADPILSARSTPIEIVPNIMSGILQGYELAKNNSYKRINTITNLAELVHSDLTYSRENCLWYSRYYNELSEIANLAGIKVINIPLNVLDIIQGELFFKNPLNLHSPVYDEYYQELYNTNKDKYDQVRNIYTLSKMFLVDMKPNFSDFVKGIPTWLIDTTNIVMYTYDKVNRRHIKIVRDNNRFRYYTAIISDNWKEVENVPADIDIIVQYLISNRANLDLANES